MRNILAVEMGRNIEWFLKYITHFFKFCDLFKLQCFIIFFSFKNNDRETNQQRSKNTTGPLFGDFGTFFLALIADHTHSADIEVPRNLTYFQSDRTFINHFWHNHHNYKTLKFWKS